MCQRRPQKRLANIRQNKILFLLRLEMLREDNSNFIFLGKDVTPFNMLKDYFSWWWLDRHLMEHWSFQQNCPLLMDCEVCLVYRPIHGDM